MLLRLVNDMKPIVDEIAATEFGPPTMFEISTALAILYFGKVAYPDYVVWETGLGGRLDSTNIVNPIVTVITNVGHDHMDILGDTLELVAAEKAGIIKAGVPVITAVAAWGDLERNRTNCEGEESHILFPWRSIYVDQVNQRS